MKLKTDVMQGEDNFRKLLPIFQINYMVFPLETGTGYRILKVSGNTDDSIKR